MSGASGRMGRRSHWGRLMGTVAIAAVGSALVAGTVGCTPSPPTSTGGLPNVVAAENVWGSLASQLGGDRVHVTSLVSNPDADPHDYEPTAADAREVATARLVIENGIGYDPWVERLLEANPAPARAVLDVGRMLGVPAGGNPHRWYSPADVGRVIDAIAARYRRIDPKHAGYFAHRRIVVERTGLRDYHRLIAEIRRRYGGAPIGGSESLVSLLAPALGLRLVTPPAFLRAVSEGAEPSAADKALIDHQIRAHQIDVYVYNRQNVTADVRRQIDEARAARIPIATVTETLVPASATFEAWQVRQLKALRAALREATGR